MAHASSRRRGLSRNAANYGLFHVHLDVFRSRLLGGTADLSDHHDGFGLRIAIEQLKRIQEVGPDNRIAADSNRGGLPDPARSELIYSFVSQRAGTRDDSD